MAGLLDYLMAKGAAPAPDTEMPSGLPVSGGAGSPLMDAFLKLQYDRLKDAVTAPRDAYSGDLQVFDPSTGHVSDEAMDRANGMAGLAMTGGIAGVARGGTTVGAGPIRAYHGSPHDFDAFSLAKIGSGEGAQAYGHGLYFAENESVARAYRDALSGGRPGHMYEVGIDVDPSKMMNYDVPLAGQAKGVQDYSSHLLSKMQERGLMRGQGLDDLAGADIPYMTKRLGIAPAQVSSELQNLGVPGVKFLDAGSRFSADKTHNFVTFSDDVVKILRKYGVASVAALPPAVRAVVEAGRIPIDESASDAPQAVNLGMRLSR